MGYVAKPSETDAPGQPGATEKLLNFTINLDWSDVPEETRHAAKRHLLDTLGAMIGGAQGDITVQVESLLSTIRPEGSIPVPGRVRRADLLDAAFLGGTSAHGIELDDGYREGAVHPGAAVVSALLPIAHNRRSSGISLLLAMIAGYEGLLAIAQAVHPALRRRGFHPTATVGTLGAAVAASKLLGLSRAMSESALGLAGSSAAGLHSYVNGGADVKRLHAGHAAREGLQAALLASQGINGPPKVLEGKDGFFQAFTSGAGTKLPDFSIGRNEGFLINSCYVKPLACCRHLQPAAEALIWIVSDRDLSTDDIHEIVVETYHLAGEMAQVGWGDFASAQLSFPFTMAAAARYRDIQLQHFSAEILGDPAIAEVCAKVRVVVTEEMDKLYPRLRPSRVSVVTNSGRFSKQVDEATGAPELPLSDDGLSEKFLGLAAPVLGQDRAAAALDRLWRIDTEADASTLLAALAV